VPDNPVGHGPFIDAVRATRQCYPVGSAVFTASYGICLTDLAWAMDGSANLSCLRAQRSDKVIFREDLYALTLAAERNLAQMPSITDNIERVESSWKS